MSCPNEEHYSLLSKSSFPDPQLSRSSPDPFSNNSDNDFDPRTVNDSSSSELKNIGSESCHSSGSSSSDPFSNNSENDFDPRTVNESSSSELHLNEKVVRKRKCEKREHDNKRQKRRKKLRNSGYSYKSIYNSSKTIKEKGLREACGEKCRLQCSKKITESSRYDIFHKYWDMSTLQRQREFIANNMKLIKPKYRYSCTQDLRRLNNAFFFEINSKQVRVCKLFFKATLGINDTVIATVIKKKDKDGFVDIDYRGKHGNHLTVNPEVKKSIRQFIKNIPRVESHYLRAQTTREYIESGKSLTDLYSDYKELRESENLRAGNKSMFYRIFKNEFNLSLFKPKKDQCDLCESFLNSDENEKKDLIEVYNIHQEEKNLCRKEKDFDKKNSTAAVYDLQAVLPLPKGMASSFYYTSKINCYNFTVSDLKAKHVECFFWTEVEGKRGANEIGSCVLQYIKNLVSKLNNVQDLDLIFYSDNCCGQQKNKYLLTMYFYALQKYNLRSITHKYLIQGHTQNEGDNVHSVIEKQVKRHLVSRPIYAPGEYTALIATAKKTGIPYKVHELSHEDFYDLKAIQEQWGKNFVVNEERQKINWHSIKTLRVEKDNIDSFFYKTSYKDKDYLRIFVHKDNLKSTDYWKNLELSCVYLGNLPLSENKKKDIMDLVKKNIIPKKYYESYYKNIIGN